MVLCQAAGMEAGHEGQYSVHLSNLPLDAQMMVHTDQQNEGSGQILGAATEPPLDEVQQLQKEHTPPAGDELAGSLSGNVRPGADFLFLPLVQDEPANHYCTETYFAWSLPSQCFDQRSLYQFSLLLLLINLDGILPPEEG